MNGCQELVELDLLICPVPGFVSIRSLGAEICHFVSRPLDFQGFPLKSIGFLKDFVMKTHKNQWISLKMDGVRTQNVISLRSEIGLRQLQWLNISPVPLYKLVTTIGDIRYILFFLEHILAQTRLKCWMGRLIENHHHMNYADPS